MDAGRSLLGVGLAVACAVAAGAASANCGPIIDAMDKAVKETRFAAWEVQQPEQPLGPEPDAVLIGPTAWSRDGSTWTRMDVRGIGELFWGPDARKRMQGGNVRCKAPVRGTYRGASAVRVEFRIDGEHDPDEWHTVWIDAASGLPVYEGNHEGGFVVVYGSAVRKPAGAR